MENASKALSIAASVLIAVLLIVLLIFAFYKFTEIPRQREQQKKTQEVAEFNKKYDSFNQRELKGIKMISLLNMVNDNNITYAGTEGFLISIEIDGTPNYQNNLIGSDVNDARNTIKSKTFSCTNVEYNGTDGRISKMIFVSR